ncbi:unnamed protein product [Spodoptera exigua]|nr:unnamed protein product [Spodoptera exigua]
MGRLDRSDTTASQKTGVELVTGGPIYPLLFSSSLNLQNPNFLKVGNALVTPRLRVSMGGADCLPSGVVFDQNTEEIQNAFKFAMLQHSNNANKSNLDFQLYVDIINTADAFKLSRLKISGWDERKNQTLTDENPPRSLSCGRRQSLLPLRHEVTPELISPHAIHKSGVAAINPRLTILR